MARDDGPSRPALRLRRLRRTPALRAMVRETTLTPAQLVLPIFIVDGSGIDQPIVSLPGQSRLSIDRAIARISEARDLGIVAFALFPRVADALKTVDAREAVNGRNLACRALRDIRRAHPEVCLIADIALDPYNSLGHDGLVGRDGAIQNDETVDLLARMAVLHADAGADIVAPSDMMDGRVSAIRGALDAVHRTDTIILSYAAKYASAFYGPFRDALDSAPRLSAEGAPAGMPTDKRTYQLDPANAREAMLEALLDEREGADILMVKPALTNLDILAKLRERTDLPLAAYHVSGEFAMLKAAVAQGWIDGRAALDETLTSIARAGADLIFTYGAIEWARDRR